ERFAILGWGSLLWDDAHPKHPKFAEQIGRWEYDGPALPVEFSRVSKTRHGALTLVLDPIHGAPVTTAWTLSKRTDIDQAVSDLQSREGTSRDRIGFVHGHDQKARAPATADVIGQWAATRGVHGVVRTDLPSNFEEKTRRPFSIEAARVYLEHLSESGKAEA